MYWPRLLARVRCLGQLVWEEGTERGIRQVRESLGTSVVQGRVSLGFLLPDEMDQTPPVRSEYLVSGIRTPPVRRNSKLATLGRLFKPWKWRKKKNEKLKQTTSGEYGCGREVGG